MLEITPNLDPASDEPMYLQLYEYLKDEIQKKEFRLTANCLRNGACPRI